MTTTSLDHTSECLAWMRRGARPRDRFRIGTELERLVINHHGERLPYAGPVSIRTLLERLASRHGWQLVTEHDQPIAATRAGASITLEPAGQMELSSAPWRTIGETRTEIDNYYAELDDVSADLGVAFCHLGIDPFTRLGDVPMMPKDRYHHMRAWMPRVGGLGLTMMHQTCTVQTNIDFSDEAEAMEMLRLGYLLTPVLLALFANSPWRNGADTGYATFRGHVWTDVDRARCDPGAFVFDPSAGLKDYCEWALDVPVYFLLEKGPGGTKRYRGMDGKTTFRMLIERGIDGRRPGEDDWALHLSTLFPDVRLKQHVEIRAADMVPPELLIALPALTKGLFYDVEARRGALALLGDGDDRIDRAALREAACRQALDGRVGDLHLGELATAVLVLAHAGLTRQHRFESDAAAFEAIAPLEALCRGEMTPPWRQVAAQMSAGARHLGVFAQARRLPSAA